MVKGHSQGHKVKNIGTIGKVLSQGIHMRNMKALGAVIQNLWTRLKFFVARSKSRSNLEVKVTRSKILIPMERSYHKEYTCET